MAATVWELAAEVFERRAARSTGDAEHLRYDTPGALATGCDPRQVQRDHLRMIDAAFSDVLAARTDRVIISTPPQVGKTQRAAVWGPFWWLTHRPQDRIILASYGAQLAATRGRWTRELVAQHGSRFGLSLSGSSAATDDWELTSGGGMRTGGMGSGITGHPADLVIIDDPHKNREEADSPRMREKIWDTYSSSILSRMSPDAPIILIATRWHHKDLIARVLDEEGSKAEGGRWLVIELPALATSPNDPLGRELGEPLPHPKIAEGDTVRLMRHWEDKRATSTVRDWGALYQCDPKPREGALLTDEMITERTVKAGERLPDRQVIGVGVDPSGGGRDTAGIVAGFLGTDQRVYWTHDLTDVMPSSEWSRVACKLAYEIGADRFVCEKNYGGDMVSLAVTTAWSKLRDERVVSGMCPRVVLVSSRRGKIIRAEPVAQQVIEDRVRFAAKLPKLAQDWTEYQVTSNYSPGSLDAGVHLVHDLLPEVEPVRVGVPAATPLPPPGGFTAGQGVVDLARLGIAR